MAESTHDSLELLRQAIRSSNLPTLFDDSFNPTSNILKASTVSFNADSSTPTNIPSSTPTRYTWASGSTELLTLQQIYYVYQERETDASGYLRNAASARVKPAQLLDRNAVLAYLIKGDLPSGRIIAKGSKPEDGQFEGAASSTTKQRYLVNESDKRVVEKIRATQIALGDKYDSLRFTPGGKVQDWTSLRRAIMDERVRPLKEQIKKQEEAAGNGVVNGDKDGGVDSRGLKRTLSGASGTSGDPNRAKKQRSTQQNILLLSSSPTALINMWNVKRFLEDGVYEDTNMAKARQQAEGNKKIEDVIVIYRTSKASNGEERKAKFYAIDNLDVLTKLGGTSAQSDPWDRVLCIFTTGQAWQFKSYKWTEPKELFSRVRGIHFHYTSEGPRKEVSDWKVRNFGIEKNQRHKDKPLSAQFWQTVEAPLAIGAKR